MSTGQDRVSVCSSYQTSVKTQDKQSPEVARGMSVAGSGGYWVSDSGYYSGKERRRGQESGYRERHFVHTEEQDLKQQLCTV